MLEDWIYKGQINDPYAEFMIVEDKEITKEKLKDEFNEKFWDKKYTINRNNTPKILEPISEKILLTGKYLNAIHETGKDFVKHHSNTKSAAHDSDEAIVNALDESDDNDDDDDDGEEKKKLRNNSHDKMIVPNAKEILFTTKEEVYKQIAEKAYNYSSKVLLNLLLKDHKLINRLRYQSIIFFCLNLKLILIET